MQKPILNKKKIARVTLVTPGNGGDNGGDNGEIF